MADNEVWKYLAGLAAIGGTIAGWAFKSSVAVTSARTKANGRVLSFVEEIENDVKALNARKLTKTCSSF